MKKIEKVYHDNGNIQQEYEVNKKGQRHGICRLYHENGQLQLELNFTNDIQDDSTIISYHDNGSKARQVIRFMGDLNGEFSEWYENGLIKRKSTYSNGRICGDYKEWDNLGNLKKDFIKNKLIDVAGSDEIEANKIKEVEINWLQDVGPIYQSDNYIPNLLLHNSETENDGEYIFCLCNDHKEAITIIDYIIDSNGGKNNFHKHEIEDWSHVFSGHLFDIRYRNKLLENYVIVEINRREKRKFISYDNDNEILYGIHKDSKKINSIIYGLNSIVYNSGEMTSGGGHLYYTVSGSHIVSYWDDLGEAIKKLKTIVDCYSENVTVESLLGTCYEISDFTYDNLKSIINKPDFLIRFKTKEFKINLSKGTSSYQMNIYFHKN